MNFSNNKNKVFILESELKKSMIKVLQKKIDQIIFSNSFSDQIDEYKEVIKRSTEPDNASTGRLASVLKSATLQDFYCYDFLKVELRTY